MTPRRWHIYRYNRTTEAVEHLREGSVRFGHTMRQAKELARFSQDTVFISQVAPPSGIYPASWRPPIEGQHYTFEPASMGEQQRRNRAQLLGVSAV